MELAEPVVPLTVLNLDDVSYLLQVRAREDASAALLKIAPIASEGRSSVPDLGSITSPSLRRCTHVPAPRATRSGAISM